MMLYKINSDGSIGVVSNPLYLDIVKGKCGNTVLAAFTENQMRIAIERGSKFEGIKDTLISQTSTK